MAVDDKILQTFFNKQRKPKIDALISIKNQKNNDKSNTKSIPKLTSNWYQSDTKTGTKLVPNQSQTGTKVVPNRNQFSSKQISESLNKYQSGVKTDTKTGTKLVPNQYQTGIKVGFLSLSGLQKKITILIYNSCKISRDKKTDAISINYIINECQNTTEGAVKTAIRRLMNKGILSRESFKNGRGGWTVYSIPDDTYQEILNLESHNKLAPNWYQTGTKVVSKLVSEVIPNSSSSGSNFLLKETTTTDDQNLSNKKSLSEVWANLDISSLAKIGFTKTHLLQIAEQNKLTPEIVQQSIFAFAFDLEHNDKAKKIKGDPLNFIMGILRNGQPYAPPLNYESPENKAMRIYLERTKAIQERQQAMEKEIFDSSFSEWLQDLSVEKKFELLPDHVKGLKRDGGIEKVLATQLAKSSLIEHFHKTIWEQKKIEILSSVRISQDK